MSDFIHALLCILVNRASHHAFSYATVEWSEVHPNKRCSGKQTKWQTHACMHPYLECAEGSVQTMLHWQGVRSTLPHGPNTMTNRTHLRKQHIHFFLTSNTFSFLFEHHSAHIHCWISSHQGQLHAQANKNNASLLKLCVQYITQKTEHFQPTYTLFFFLFQPLPFVVYLKQHLFYTAVYCCHAGKRKTDQYIRIRISIMWKVFLW